jgi:hypothetical protein
MHSRSFILDLNCPDNQQDKKINTQIWIILSETILGRFEPSAKNQFGGNTNKQESIKMITRLNKFQCNL